MHTAPPTAYSTSFSTLPVLAATPVCKAGAPVVPLPCTPALPLGVASTTWPPTIVVAVTIEELPPEKIIVCTARLVEEGRVVFAVTVVESSSLVETDAIVFTPPPTVLTITTPTGLVIVKTEPLERDEDAAALGGTDDAVAVGEGVPEAGALVTVVLEEPTGWPSGVTRAVLLIWLGLEAEGLSSAMRLVLEAGGVGGEEVATVPLVTDCRLAKLTILAARGGLSRWMASTAVRSSGNIPCANFFGECS